MTIDVRAMLGDDVYEGVRELVRRTFPDKRCEIGNSAVDAFVAGLPEEAQLALCGAKLAAEEILGMSLPEDSAVVCYYNVKAKHSRVAGPGQHSFVNELPMVRVRLPDAEARDIDTKIGRVYAGDHKLYTVDHFRQKYGQTLGKYVKYVELITPARYPAHLGARFSAVSVFALYGIQRELVGYVLEAGMATGEPMVCYLGGTPDATIHQPSWYEPTPFSDERNWYFGGAVWKRDELRSVNVDVREEKEGKPHMKVRATFDRLTNAPDPVFPAKLTALAGLRVAAIAQAMGKADPVMSLLAPFGRELTWLEEPKGT